MKLFVSIQLTALSVLLFLSCTDHTHSRSAGDSTTATGFYQPWQSLGALFQAVQVAGVYPDSKTFADAVPRRNPEEIAADYQELRGQTGFDLEKFVLENFDVPPVSTTVYESTGDFRAHLRNHWDYLTRSSPNVQGHTTLIPLPGEYVVPGGRFREIYYWDSYFTMIGLGVSGRVDLVRAMLDNFAYLIDTVGFIPNGNRTYYLGRSQPPFFASMVNLYIQLTSVNEGLIYLPALQKEYDFWMQGAEELTAETPAINRVVRLNDGTVLNRYWDFLDFPRPEAYKEDFAMAVDLPDAASRRLYRNLRAGAESGWDYSTRWFEDTSDFASIRTTDLLPVDLNSLMYSMETILTSLYEQTGNAEKANAFYKKAQARKEAIQRIFWEDSKGAFTDYLWTERRLSEQLTLAGAYPLYFRVATQEQADRQARVLASEFLLPGGLVTTRIVSGQQWDAPNGWAPLQWISIKGLQHYGAEDLATEITRRWLKVNEKVYKHTGKMMEKYNVADTTLLAGGGEYPTQDGFGWTNGVALGLMTEQVVY